MFANPYFSQQYFSESYFPPLVDVVIPTPPRGGGGTGPSGPSYNQSPSVIGDKRLYIDQALNEDEELIILLKAFAEVIQWH